MGRFKRLIGVALSGAMLVSMVQFQTVFADEKEMAVAVAAKVETLADWSFGKDSVTGNANEGTIRVADSSGNNNDLVMQYYKEDTLITEFENLDYEGKYVTFTEETMLDSEADSKAGSVKLEPSNETKTGVDFVTTKEASINSEEFRNGYTFEFIYKMPTTWVSSTDKWSGLMGRQGTSNAINEPEMGSLGVSVSDGRQVQYQTANADDNHTMFNSVWSPPMIRDNWYHIAVVSDNNVIRIYVNGVDSSHFSYVSDEMVGIFADKNDGRIRLASQYWQEDEQTIDAFLRGSLERVRITNAPLTKEDWLIPNPIETLEIPNNGNTEPFEMVNAESNYNMVFIPDTQYVVKNNNESLDSATDWLVENKDTAKIAAIAHLGDITDGNTDAEWDSSVTSFYKLAENGINSAMLPGNHDVSKKSYEKYLAKFGPDSEWEKLLVNDDTNNTVYSKSGRNSYMLFEAGSFQYLIISIGYNNADENYWVERVLKAYPNNPTMILTHYMANSDDNEESDSTIKLAGQGNGIWEIAKKYNQVFMLMGGHISDWGHKTLVNEYGNDVYLILADYQSEYGGGNNLMKFAEFDEAKNKIYMKTFSPYVAELEEDSRTYFDITYLDGVGNDDVFEVDFNKRFKPIVKNGKWLAGEYHTHTGMSPDANGGPVVSVENNLDTAFNKYKLDFLVLADHLRMISRDADYASLKTPIANYMAIEEYQIPKIESLQEAGKYKDKIIYSGFEWDVLGFDHAAVGIINNSDDDSLPIDALKQFEYLYSKDTKIEMFSKNDIEAFGPRKNADEKENTFDAISWLDEKYPLSYALINHPSRKNGSDSQTSIEDLRKMNDLAPEIVFGFEGVLGNQMAPDRGELPAGNTFGGTDIMVAKVGGIWDALLGEGRNFWNFANSDFHFKLNVSRRYSSGYWPGEYTKNYFWVEGNDIKAVVDSMRSGKTFAVMGDIINALDFKATVANDVAEMGEHLQATEGDTVTLTIRFKSPATNNYEQITPHDTTVSNVVNVDHVDLISGEVTGKISSESDDYSKATNDSTKVIARFTEKDWKVDRDGYNVITYTIPSADKDRYYRLRGTNLGVNVAGETQNGEPLVDEYFNDIKENEVRFNAINDRNYNDLWFYSNPIFVDVNPLSDSVAVRNTIKELDARFNVIGESEGVTTNFGVPVVGSHGVSIKWESSNENVISFANGAAFVASKSNATVTLTATISRGSISLERVYIVSVKAPQK